MVFRVGSNALNFFEVSTSFGAYSKVQGQNIHPGMCTYSFYSFEIPYNISENIKIHIFTDT